MEVLLVGNTDFITKQWIQHSFPRDHVVIAEREGTVDGNDRLRIVNMSDANTLAETLTTYEFDRIVFFSEGLTPRSERDGDLGYLRRLLHAIRNRSTQMLMVCGPESEFTYPENADVRDTSKSLMSRASEELCLYYARTYRLEAKIIRCPYLYAPSAMEQPHISADCSNRHRQGRSHSANANSNRHAFSAPTILPN